MSHGPGSRRPAHPLLLREAHARDRRRNVDEHRIARRRNPRGDRVRRDDRRDAAVRDDGGEQRVGALDDRDESALGGAKQIGGKTGDVVRAADDDRAGAVDVRHRRRCVERAQREPRPGQPLPVPQLCSRPRADDLRRAGLRHAAPARSPRDTARAARGRASCAPAGPPRPECPRRRSRCRRACRRGPGARARSARSAAAAKRGAGAVTVRKASEGGEGDARRLTRPRDSPTILPDARLRSGHAGRGAPSDSLPCFPPR